MTTPIKVLSFGAGVQSTTLLRMMILGEVEPADHAIFSDTGWEPQSVYDNMKKMRLEAEKAGIEFHVVSNGNIREEALDPSNGFASMPVHVIGLEGKPIIGRRQCTKKYKLQPIMDKQRELAGLKRYARSKEHLITSIIGISLDEIARIKHAMFPWIVNQYPLVDKRFTRQNCLDWNSKHKYDLPPRSACIGCPYHNDEDWLQMKQNDPKSWDDAVEFDEQLRSNPELAQRVFQGRSYLHRQRIPLSVVKFSIGDTQKPVDMFNNECEGMCGV